MRRFLSRSTHAVIALLMWHGVALACVYPMPLRVTNETLLSILDGGGKVSNHQRDRLARAMAQMSPDDVKRALSQEARRRDARAAHAVIDTALALASGRGMTVDEGLRDDLFRLDQAVDASCSGSDNAVSGTEDADGAEHGVARRQTGRGGRALTFREGVLRLSLTFTLYMVFLAVLLGLRRHLRQRAAETAATSDPLQGNDVTAP
ncbi:hypothetical protein [uncultured Tateyamaria sp.]|uniref:hypothetical protein n=1 Tax=uncultured Tateyamaria sp. TaxID=455651 RepID=UPI002607E217|nr:hypothetical protein [uncultured Tateyamaria sp.]